VAYLCAHAEYDRAEAALATLEYALSRRLAEPRLHADVFSEAEREWRGFRDGECLLLTCDSRADTAFESYRHRCLRELTEQRSVKLRALLDGRLAPSSPAAAPPATGQTRAPDWPLRSAVLSLPPVAEAPRAPDPCAASENVEALAKCERAEYARAEEAVQRREAQLRERYAAEPFIYKVTSLDRAQIEWRKFRDAECVFSTFGSLRTPALAAHSDRCLRDRDWERAALLQYLLDS